MKKLIIGLMLLFSTLVLAEDVIDIQRGVSVELADSNGSTQMNVDGNATSVIFSAVPAEGEKWIVYRIIGYMEGTTAFDSLTFGNLPALANGVEIRINGILTNTVNDNLELSLKFGAKDAPLILGKEKRAMLGEWCLEDSFGKPVLISNTSGGITFTINDDLSGLTDYHVVVQGRKY